MLFPLHFSACVSPTVLLNLLSRCMKWSLVTQIYDLLKCALCVSICPGAICLNRLFHFFGKCFFKNDLVFWLAFLMFKMFLCVSTICLNLVSTCFEWWFLIYLIVSTFLQIFPLCFTVFLHGFFPNLVLCFVFAVRLGQLQCKPPRAKAARILSQPEPAVKRLALSCGHLLARGAWAKACHWKNMP